MRVEAGQSVGGGCIIQVRDDGGLEWGLAVETEKSGQTVIPV